MEDNPSHGRLRLLHGKEIRLRSTTGDADSASLRNRGVLTPLLVLWHLCGQGSRHFFNQVPPPLALLNTHSSHLGAPRRAATPFTNPNGASPGRPRAGLQRSRLCARGWCNGGCSCHRTERGPCQPLAVVQLHTGAIQPSAGRGRERRQVGTQPRHPGEGLRVTDGSCGQIRVSHGTGLGSLGTCRARNGGRGSANGLAKGAGRGNG